MGAMARHPVLRRGLGLVFVPKAKLMRAEAALREALTGKMEFGAYRALMGLLEHLRCVDCADRSVMFSLYEPHGAGGVSSLGPTARVSRILHSGRASSAVGASWSPNLAAPQCLRRTDTPRSVHTPQAHALLLYSRN